MSYGIRKEGDGQVWLDVASNGAGMLHNPLLNKGTAFTEDERRTFGLTGLLPPHVSSMDEQLSRVYENYLLKPNNIEKYIYLRALQDRNETLFYSLLSDHVDEMTPIIYTPTVGEAVQKGSHIYRYSRGLYISPGNVSSIDTMAKNLPSRDIEIIVVTDNQGILGIGDQGVGGMGIPIGKLSLYTIGAGVAPHACLPICLDVGTNNEALLSDPLYLGHKHKRYSGEEYDEFIERFVEEVSRSFPNALLQWEDFSKQNAFTNLERFREKILSFNDDIQGTGAVALAGILGAMRIKRERLEEQCICVFGAGAGGVGVARQIQNALMERGLSEKEARSRLFVVHSRGLIVEGGAKIDEYKKSLATDRALVADWEVANRENITLAEVVKNGGITVLLGLSGQPGKFTQDIVERMGQNCSEPVIFPLSNPTANVEALPAEIYKWTKGRAIVATGSPFDDVVYKERRFRVGQGNNVFIFPGVGLGALAARATSITDGMFTAAANRLAEFTPQDARTTKCVFPSVGHLNQVSEQVALAVFNVAVEDGVATVDENADPLKTIRKRVWKPEYLPYRIK